MGCGIDFLIVELEGAPLLGLLEVELVVDPPGAALEIVDLVLDE